MMSMSYYRSGRAAFAVLLLPGLVLSCDNPVAVEEHEEEPFGVVLLDGATTVASAIGTEVEGGIQVAAGATTNPLAIEFVDDHGEVLAVEPDHHRVELQVKNPAIATAVPVDGVGFAARVQGETPGTTFVRAVLLHEHDEEFEVEWFSGWIPVTVTAAGP